jgi:predicted phosphodiesterase
MTADKIVHNSRNVQTVYFENVKSGWEQWVLLVSDQHHDSHDCARKLEKEHLDLALSRGAYIISAGDTFDMMQGHYDPRKSYAGMRPEYLMQMIDQGNEAYFDIITQDAIEFYKSYAHLVLVVGRGNHDTSIEKHNGISPVGNLVFGLNRTITGDHRIQAGGFGGWVKFNFSTNGGKSNRSSMRLKYYHGGGGDAPVTRGMIQTARQAVYLPDADIVLNGHNHQSYTTSIARERLNDAGKITFDVVDYIRTPGYSCGYGDGHSGFEAERMPPKPIGCVWMRLFSRDGRSVSREFTASIQGGNLV